MIKHQLPNESLGRLLSRFNVDEIPSPPKKCPTKSLVDIIITCSISWYSIDSNLVQKRIQKQHQQNNPHLTQTSHTTTPLHTQTNARTHTTFTAPLWSFKTPFTSIYYPPHPHPFLNSKQPQSLLSQANNIFEDNPYSTYSPNQFTMPSAAISNHTAQFCTFPFSFLQPTSQ